MPAKMATPARMAISVVEDDLPLLPFPFLGTCVGSGVNRVKSPLVVGDDVNTGAEVGATDGLNDGVDVGIGDGIIEGGKLGTLVAVGGNVGTKLGKGVGDDVVGAVVGVSVGTFVGATVGRGFPRIRMGTPKLFPLPMVIPSSNVTVATPVPNAVRTELPNPKKSSSSCTSIAHAPLVHW